MPSEANTKVSPVGRSSQCETYREVIQAKLHQQLSAQRIWQDLVAEQGFTGKYDSVKRFVRRLIQRQPLPFRRMEVPPGEEAQVDFGTGARVVGPDGKRRKTHVFRIVLSYSGSKSGSKREQKGTFYFNLEIGRHAQAE